MPREASYPSEALAKGDSEVGPQPMKLYRLNAEQKKLWADKLLDLANFALVGLVFGQIASGKKPEMVPIAIGSATYVMLAILATYLGR